MEKDIIKIIEPSNELYSLIDEHKAIVKNALSNCEIALIGSAAVPMCGKEEFDLVVEVDNVEEAQRKVAENSLGKIGIGPIIKGVGYCRSKKRFGIICELHIMLFGHGKKKMCLRLVKKLQDNPTLLEKYENMKYSLDGKPEKLYKEKKEKFILGNDLI